jgi:hypothetical protein
LVGSSVKRTAENQMSRGIQFQQSAHGLIAFRSHPSSERLGYYHSSAKRGLA